jgi:hypothetical protein
MQGARSRRVGSRVGSCLVAALLLAACTGGGVSHSGSGGTGAVDVKAACAALAELKQSAKALNGVDVADPERSQEALAKAVDAYDTALVSFERVAPQRLRAPAGVVRDAVAARHFSDAVAARAPIDAWAAKNCP